MHIFMSPQRVQDHGFWCQAVLHTSIGIAALAVLVLCLCKTEKQAAIQLVKLRQAPQGAGVADVTQLRAADNEKTD
jgi:hypothetical protein